MKPLIKTPCDYCGKPVLTTVWDRPSSATTTAPRGGSSNWALPTSTRPKILSPFRRHQVAVLVVRVFPERVDKRVVGCGRLPRVVRAHPDVAGRAVFDPEVVHRLRYEEAIILFRKRKRTYGHVPRPFSIVDVLCHVNLLVRLSYLFTRCLSRTRGSARGLYRSSPICEPFARSTMRSPLTK